MNFNRYLKKDWRISWEIFLTQTAGFHLQTICGAWCSTPAEARSYLARRTGGLAQRYQGNCIHWPGK